MVLAAAIGMAMMRGDDTRPMVASDDAHRWHA